MAGDDANKMAKTRSLTIVNALPLRLNVEYVTNYLFLVEKETRRNKFISNQKVTLTERKDR